MRGILDPKESVCCICSVASSLGSAPLLSYGFLPVLPSDFHLCRRFVILRVWTQLL